MLALVIVASLVATNAIPAPAFADTPSPLAWSVGSVDPSSSPPPSTKGIACPDPVFCVAIDASNDVVTSTDPSGAWRVTAGVDTSGLQLEGVSCPSENLCVAVDEGGNVITSTDPTGGASTWKAKSGVASAGFAGISCPTTTLCVAVTTDGHVLHTVDPKDGATATWSSIALTPTPGAMTGISCATATLCVAVGNGPTAGFGVIYATSSPTTTVATDWMFTSPNTPLQGVSCPTNSFCAALANDSGDAQVIVSTNPAGGAWSTPDPIESTGAVLTGLSCPSATLCVAVDSTGTAFTSTDPTGGPLAPWTRASVTLFSADGLSAVACTADSFCVATTSTATPSQFWTTDDPTAGTSGWSQSNTGGVPINDVACPSTGLCVGVDDIGNVLTSTNPVGGSSSWSIAQATGPTLLSVSCPATTLCVATDVSGDVVTSANPAGGSTAWTTSNVDGLEAIFAVSCPTTTFCAAVDDAGDVLTSTNPSGGSGAWSSVNIDGSESIYGISCPNSSLCVAVDDLGNVLVSTDPTGGAGAWRLTAVDPGNALDAVSCVSDALCVAVDDAGNVVTSTAPASATPGWTSASVDDTALDAVSCPSTTMCVAVDDSGFEVNSIDPAGGANEWTGTTIDGNSLYGISCPDTSGCAVVDSNGNAAWGGVTPSNLTVPSITGQAIQGSQLTEVHGTWTPAATSFGLQWERCDASGDSCSDISGATGSAYTLVAADVGSTIRVLELGSNANGAGATVESAQTAVVAGPPPRSTGGSAAPTGGRGSTIIKHVTTRGTAAEVLVSCTGSAGATCALVFKITVRETIKGDKVTAVTATTRLKQKVLTLGTTTVKLAAGQSRIVKVSLNSAGKRLLSHRHKLKAKLAVIESGKTIFRKTITFKSKPTKKR